jgi:hypothetical protein
VLESGVVLNSVVTLEEVLTKKALSNRGNVTLGGPF